MLWIAKGTQVPRLSLQILLIRAQMDMNDLIARFGPDGVPGNPNVPTYSFLTKTPAGAEGYFFISTLSRGTLNYGLANETLVGLKIFLLDQGRNEQVVFEVEGGPQRYAFGGLSITQGAEVSGTLSNNTAVVRLVIFHRRNTQPVFLWLSSLT